MVLDPIALPGDLGWATFVATNDDSIPSNRARLKGDNGFQGVPNRSVVSAQIRSTTNLPCIVDGEYQNPNEAKTVTPEADGTWYLDLSDLPETHYWEINIFGVKTKLIPLTPYLGTEVQLEDVIAPTC